MTTTRNGVKEAETSAPGTISIRATAVLKFVLAPLWIIGAVYAIWVLASRPERMLGDYGSGGMVALQLALLALLGAGIIVAIVFVVPLKRVQLEPGGIRVSNFIRETAVPFADIASARQHWLPTFRLVTLRLRNDTPLGRRVIFMPAVPVRAKFWRSSYWREDELVERLQSLSRARTELAG